MKKLFIICIASFLLVFGANAQELPLSIADRSILINTDAIEINNLQQGQVNEDESFDLLNYTYAITFAKINVLEYGKWYKNKDGEWIWIVKVSSQGAKSLGFDLEGLRLENDDKLFLYTLNDNIDISKLQNMSEKIFQSDFLNGDEIYLEYNPEKNDTTQTFSERLILNRGLREVSEKKEFGDSGDCQINANCNTDKEKQFEKRATVKIRTRKTINGNIYYGWCTGTLIATTEMQYEPYILTADHCYSIMQNGNYIPPTDEDMENWLFIFNYESADCENPASELEISPTTFQGALRLANAGGAGDYDSDFCLLKLKENIDASVNAFWAGWNAIDEPTYNGYSYHHPQGDIKKINIFGGNTTSSKYDPTGPDGTHWKITWVSGATEGGSSGSSILNDKGQILGVLTGGLSSCFGTEPTDYYGKFSRSYEWGSSPTNQLKYWLNPTNEDIVELLGYDYNGVKSLEFEEELSIVGNPVTDGIINLGVIDLQKLKLIRIYNISGQLMWESDKVNNTRLKLDLKTGIYIMESEYNSKRKKEKILVVN